MLWYSHIHPKRVKLPNDTESSPEKDDRYIQEIMHNSQACPPDFNVEWILDDLTIPIWVLHGLDIAETKIQDMFAYASILSLSEGPRWQEVFQTVAAIELYWDMPEWMFMLWIDAHTDQQSLAEKMEWKSSFGCRVIPDADGRIQLIPFWMIVSKRLERGEIDRKPSIYQYPVHKRPPKLCVFGNPESEDHCIVTTSKDSAEDRSMRCFQTGYEPFSAYMSRNEITLEDLLKRINQQSMEMWASLCFITKRASILNVAKVDVEMERPKGFHRELSFIAVAVHLMHRAGVGDFLHYRNTYPNDDTMRRYCRRWFESGGHTSLLYETPSDVSGL
ncbi:MAG: hypothetical protein Q9223_005849 [Gallowayella weberi]